MKWILSIIIALIFLRPAPVSYYISSSTGSDSNPGTIAQPFKTLAKLNSITLHGDDAVYLKAGDTWNEQLPINQSGTSGHPITISWYGAGARPIITGISTISSWANIGGNIYETNAAIGSLNELNMVTIDGIPFAMGRYPKSTASNGGYLTYQSGSTTVLTSNAISTVPNFSGAQAVIRLNRSAIDRCVITGQTSTTVTYTPTSGTAPTAGYGFFFENSLATLSTINGAAPQFGEWYYNPSSKKLDMCFTGGVPSNYTIKAATIDTLVKASSKSFVTLDNIDFEGSNKATISVSGGTGFIIQNCTIKYSGRDAMLLAGTNTFQLYNSYVEYSHNKGINGFQSQAAAPLKAIIDTFNHTGMFIGMGNPNHKLVGFPFEAIEISATAIGSLVERVNVRGVGYTGIRMDMTNNGKVDSCWVDSSCLTMDDGGGIYTWNNNGGTLKTNFKITHNVVTNCVGNFTGTNSTAPAGESIYADDFSNGAEISYNTVYGGQDGIFCHDAYNMNLYGNLIYNALNQIRIKLDVATLLSGYSVKQNICFAKQTNQFAIFFDGTAPNTIGTIDSNYYCRPIFEPTGINSTSSTAGGVVKVSPSTRYYSLDQWKATFTTIDQHTKKTWQTVNNTNKLRFEYDPLPINMTIPLGTTYINAVDGTQYLSSVTLAPYAGVVMIDTVLFNAQNTQDPNDFQFGFTGHNTHIGMLVNGSMSLTDKLTIASTFGVHYIRDGQTMTQFNGSVQTAYRTWYDAGFKMIENIQYQLTNPPVPFPSNQANYTDTLNRILNTMVSRPPDVVVCENEEQNNNNFTQNVNPGYFNELTWFTQAVHAKGWKAANGGLTDNTGLDILVYRALQANYSQAIADDYAAYSMTTGQVNAAKTPGSNPTLDARASAMLTILQTYASIGVDYINLHMSYERNIDPNALASDTNTLSKNVVYWRAWYVRKITGKKVMSNEVGTSNLSGPLVTLMLEQYTTVGYDYLLWFNGDGGGGVNAKALNDQTAPYILRTNGVAFQGFLNGSLP